MAMVGGAPGSATASVDGAVRGGPPCLRGCSSRGSVRRRRAAPELGNGGGGGGFSELEFELGLGLGLGIFAGNRRHGSGV